MIRNNRSWFIALGQVMVICWKPICWRNSNSDGSYRLLIDHLEDWARGWRAEETILWVFGANLSAIEFYRDLGFEVVRGGQDAESGARFGALAMRREIGSPAS